MVCFAKSSLNMDVLDHSDDQEVEQSRCTSSRSGSRFGKRRAKQTSSHQHLPLLMDCVGGSDNGEAAEETVPLPDYERLAQSARLPEDDTDDLKDPAPPSAPVHQQTPANKEASPPQPPPTQKQQKQKPAAWRLIEYVRSRNRAGGGGDAAGGCGVGSDGDSKSSDGEQEGEEAKKKKKRSSWLPDPDRRWPVQGFY